MSNRYYQDELNYIQSLGAEFAKRHPDTAGMLGADASDPDVERLLQGFAFLTARLHERLDNQFSQVAEGFLSVLWPQVLCPVPSITMVQFSPDRQVLRNDLTIERGTQLQTSSYDWGQLRFQTCRPVRLYPFALREVKLESHGDSSLMRFIFELNSSTTLEEANLDQLPIYISGEDPRFTYGWYLWMTQNVQRAVLVSDSVEKPQPVSLHPIGFDDEETLIPYGRDEIPGHRILREFFAFPENFLSIKVDDISALKEMEVKETFELQLDFGGKLPSGAIREIKPDSFRLFCVPAINLFESSARIALDHTRTEYLVRSDEFEIDHHEVFDVVDARGTETGPEGEEIVYRPFYDRSSLSSGKLEDIPRYRVRFTDIEVKRKDRPLIGRECFISFDNPSDEAIDPKLHTVSLQLICANRQGAHDLKPGDLCRPSEDIPAFVNFVNIGRSSMHRQAPRSPEHLWRLVSSFSVSRQSLTSLENLKSVLGFHGRLGTESSATVDRWLDGLFSLDVRPAITASNGSPMRVLKTTLEFDCETDRAPEFYLFGGIISEFLRHIASLNTRLDFNIRFRRNPDLQYKWPSRRGTCATL